MSSPGPDAMVSCAADDDGEWDEEYWCGGCLRDRTLSMSWSHGRLMGTCEYCCQRLDYTPPDDDLATAVTGECPLCGPSTFTEMTDEEFFGTSPPMPEEGDGTLWVCLRCGCYPVGGVVSRPVDRLPTRTD